MGKECFNFSIKTISKGFRIIKNEVTVYKVQFLDKVKLLKFLL